MDDFELQRLMRLLPPPPPRWVQAAKELPFVDFDHALRTDAAATLELQGYDLSSDVVAHMLKRLPRSDNS